MNRIGTTALGLFLYGAAAGLAGRGQVWAANAPCEEDLFVSVTGNPETAAGSAGNPYRTITKAVERAREIRSGCANRITIHVGPGDYAGSFPIGGSTVETLPIMIDIPDLELRGSTILDMDDRDLPAGTTSSATTLTITGNSDELTAMIFVASDAGQTHRVTVSGFVLDASGGSDPVTFGLAIDRAQDFVVRGNIVTGLPGPYTSNAGYFDIGISTRAASGLIDANYVTVSFIGIAVTGGDAVFPATITVTRNRSTGNREGGLIINGTGDSAYPFNPRPESTTADFFNTMSATAAANDISGNTDCGLRVISRTLLSASPTSQLTATIRNNTMSKNGLGICIDAGHADRANPLLNNGSIAATFQNNVVSSSSLNSSILSFTSYLAALKPQQLLVADALSTIPPSYKYLQQSTYTLTHTGELSGVWIDHPVQDPVDCRTLCNILQINGVDMPPPIRSAGLGPAFLQSFVPMAPFPSACPPPLPQPLPQCAPQL